MSEESPFQLKHTNVSRPRLSHSNSQQSIAASQAASEGYYSLSENNWSESDEASKLQFQTPPSQNRSTTPSHEHLLQASEAPITSLRGIGIPRQPQQPQRANPTNDRPQSPTVSTIAEERPDTQEGRVSQPCKQMDSDSLATTPGQDTTPYIRFAIDQLTRDEEVRGSRLYPQVATREEEDYPVERIVSDDGLGYMAQEEETQRRMSQHMPPKPQKPAPTHNTGRKLPAPMSVALPRAMQTATPGGVPADALYNNTHRPESATSQPQRDLFVPFTPSDSSLPHAPLHFLPSILRPLWLGLLIALCLLMLGALIFCAVYSNRDGGLGLWEYGTFGDSRYFLFEYLPTIFGMIIFLWVIQVQVALQRIVPFMSMASDSFLKRSEAVLLQLYPLQFLFPHLEHFKAGQPLVGGCYLVFWLFSWTIPLLASCFNVRYDLDRRSWIWVAAQAVIWATATLYILLILALVSLLVFLRKQTGLKWDPRSLADIIALLERSNIMADYDGSETFQKGDWNRLRNRSDRIGYWSTTKRPNDVFYGIGEEGGAARRYSIEQGRIREKGPERAYPSQRQGDFSIRMDLRDQRTRLRYLPWYLRDTSVIAWIVTAIILLVAFLVVSFVNDSIRLGFLPQVYARTNTAGFSASNFLYSFIPALIGHILFLTLLTFDYSLRALRPYIALSSMGGATAEASLLVDYACRLPVSVTIAALENRHYQVTILSLVSLCSASIPVLAGGCFWTQFYPGDDAVRVAADLPGYYALCFFLALYGISLVALLPGRRRGALPHRSNTLAEIISWVYQSPILADRAFARPQTKPELVTRLMGTAYLERTWGQSLTALVRPSRDNLREPSPMGNEKRGKGRVSDPEKRDSVLDPGKIKYGFGIHVGRDGLEHLGIDRVRRGGERSGRELVIWEEQQKRKSWSGSMV